ncbi:hypothetical protein [Pedobacter flavus]|uniref:Uncharacterized protein n=1 Tax=Pedobacter flavus TaxID=3113906 RepID=A0ABU7H0E8_9SPHI|nr:hypothetical protein [Pedobacter sp. VNH31]MEE1884703.1 hypothetical protein [Pedobacter sp. VNH31]
MNGLNLSDKRAISIIRKAINALNLDLRGKIILTEVGSQNYIYTPIIPLLAGAEKVYAFTKDTSYGKACEIKDRCFHIAFSIGLADKLEVGENILDTRWLSEADIITNSGMLRPLDKDKLIHVKDNAVIPLMFEAWEFRREDLDLDFCRLNNIKVAGTWENHPKIRVFDAVSALAIKMAFEAGFEVVNNKIIIWSDDHFGDQALKAFSNLGAAQCIITTDAAVLLQNIHDVDFIFIADYSETADYSEILNVDQLLTINNTFGLVHLYGSLYADFFLRKGISVYPPKDGRAQVMTYTLGHVGMHPIINLLTAGFKVGQELILDDCTNLTQKL